MDLSDYLKLQPKQQLAIQTLFNPKCKYLLYGGAMAGGKSFLLRWSALLYLIFLYKKYAIRGAQVGLFSEDYPTLKDRQIARIQREFPAWLGKLKDDKVHGLSFVLPYDLGEGVILLRNLDDPAKYMSTEFAGEFVEELTRNPEQTFMDLRNRLRYPGIVDVKFMGASNPGGVGHGWVRKYFIDKIHPDPERERFYYVHANAYDNKYINENYIRQLESLPEAKRKAYLEGSWDVFAGQVFSEFNRKTHVVSQFKPGKDKFHLFIGGLDWGRAMPFSNHITGIQLKKTTEGVPFYRAWTFLELYGTEKAPKEWGELLKAELNDIDLSLKDIRFIEADNQIFTKNNDNSKSIRDQFRDVDNEYLRILRPASKDRIGGVENIHQWLSIAPDGLPYWLITDNCKNLIRTLPELVYDENKQEDVDTSGEDHAFDDQKYQFKAIKWIDAKVGGVGITRQTQVIPHTVELDPKTGKEVSIDINAFVR